MGLKQHELIIEILTITANDMRARMIFNFNNELKNIVAYRNKNDLDMFWDFNGYVLVREFIIDDSNR